MQAKFKKLNFQQRQIFAATFCGFLLLGGVAGFGSNAMAAVELAKVNGKAITQADLEAALGGMNEGQRQALLSDSVTKKQILESLIDQEILIQEAQKQKLEDSDEFKMAIKQFTRQYLFAQAIEKGVASKLTESAAKKFYENNSGLFNTDQAFVRHILVSDELEARKLMKKAQEKGADFARIAEASSKDPSAKNNRGTVGWINRESPFVEEFKKAAFSAKKGEIVGPVKTTFGYHVIQVMDTKVGRTLGYDEVELKVKAALREWLAKDYVSKLKTRAKVEMM